MKNERLFEGFKAAAAVLGILLGAAATVGGIVLLMWGCHAAGIQM